MATNQVVSLFFFLLMVSISFIADCSLLPQII